MILQIKNKMQVKISEKACLVATLNQQIMNKDIFEFFFCRKNQSVCAYCVGHLSTAVRRYQIFSQSESYVE